MQEFSLLPMKKEERLEPFLLKRFAYRSEGDATAGTLTWQEPLATEPV